jgi:hypothetical protein
MRDLNGHDWFVLFFSARNVKLLGRSLHHWLFYYLQHWHLIYLIFRMDVIGWKFMERAVSQLPLLIARAWLNRFSDFCLRFLTIPFLIMNLHNPSLVVLLSRCYEALFCPLSLFCYHDVMKPFFSLSRCFRVCYTYIRQAIFPFLFFINFFWVFRITSLYSLTAMSNTSRQTYGMSLMSRFYEIYLDNKSSFSSGGWVYATQAI